MLQYQVVTYLLLAECEVRTAILGMDRVFSFLLWPKRAGHENKEGENEDP